MGRKTMRMKMTKRGKMTKRRRKTRGGKNTPKPDSVEKRRLELLKGYRNDAQQKINNRENNFGFIKTQTIGHDNASINVDKLVLKRIFGHNNKSIDLDKLSTGSYGFPAEANQRSIKSAEKSSLLKKSSSLKKLKTKPSKNTSSERKRKEAKELEAFLKAKQASQKRGEKRVVLDY